MQDKLTKLEKTVLEQYVSGNDINAKRLRAQLAMLNIESREYTSVGFNTCFSLPAHAPTLSEDFDEKLANVHANHPQAPAGAEFLLQIEKGKIKSLSGYVFVGTWPANESGFRILRLDYSVTNPQVETG